MACTTGCPTQDCPDYGYCLRNKGAAVVYANSAAGRDLTAQKQWDRNLDAYRAARAEGIQPKTTKRSDVERAKILSDVTQQPFGGGV